MKLKRAAWLLLILLLVQGSSMAQNRVRKEIRIPDIPGYLTLKADLHTHTVFSDGLVWPTIRPEEAWREGLDVLAITDHIEYQPHSEDLSTDHNRSFELARPLAQELGLILIRGAEITRQMPPGHFNALFLQDANALDVSDWREAFRQAMAQNAFIIWNHPGWRQPDEIPIWYPEHTEILENGWMHGMEIANEFAYYPLAFTWCLEKGIAPLGCSDIHSTMGLEYDLAHREHRATTLIFARERTEASVREALFAGRTAVYRENALYGPEEFLAPVFKASVRVLTPEARVSPGGSVYLQVHNSSDLDLVLTRKGASGETNYPEQLRLPAQRTSLVRIGITEGTRPGRKNVSLAYQADNLQTAPGVSLPVSLDFTLVVLKDE